MKNRYGIVPRMFSFSTGLGVGVFAFLTVIQFTLDRRTVLQNGSESGAASFLDSSQFMSKRSLTLIRTTGEDKLPLTADGHSEEQQQQQRTKRKRRSFRLLCVVLNYGRDQNKLLAINRTYAEKCTKILYYGVEVKTSVIKSIGQFQKLTGKKLPNVPEIPVIKTNDLTLKQFRTFQFLQWVIRDLTTVQNVIENHQPPASNAQPKSTSSNAQQTDSNMKINKNNSFDYYAFLDDMTFLIPENLYELAGRLNPDFGPFAVGRTVSSPTSSSTTSLTMSWWWPSFLFRGGSHRSSPPQNLLIDSGIILEGSAMRAVSRSVTLDGGPCTDARMTEMEAGAGFSECLWAEGIPVIDASGQFYPDSFRSLVPRSSESSAGASAGTGGINPNSGIFSIFNQFFKTETCCNDRAITFGGLRYRDFYLVYYTTYHLRAYGVDN